MINKKIIKRNFSKACKKYNDYANVQLIMANKIINMIKKDNIKSILEIGCGTGILTIKLLKKFKDIKLTLIDISEDMLQENKKNLIKEGIDIKNIDFICCDAEAYNSDEKFDLIISNAAFQWFNSFKGGVEKYVNLLNNNGQLLVSTFGEDTFIELELSCIKATKELRIENKFKVRKTFLKNEEIENVLKNLNKSYNFIEERIKEYHKDPWEFLKSVKNIGANMCSNEKVVTPPSVMKKILEVYSREFTKDDLAFSTYHCIYIDIKMAS